VRTLIADLGDAYCEQLRRTAIGPFRVADADPEHVVELNDALAFMPEVRLDDEHGRRAAHGVAVPVPEKPPGDVIRLVDRHGLIALAQPLDGGRMLKPFVGLRG
jgi:tRNA pseudouridine55 synthase